MKLLRKLFKLVVNATKVSGSSKSLSFMKTVNMLWRVILFMGVKGICCLFCFFCLLMIFLRCLLKNLVWWEKGSIANHWMICDLQNLILFQKGEKEILSTIFWEHLVSAFPLHFWNYFSEPISVYNVNKIDGSSWEVEAILFTLQVVNLTIL